MNIFKKLKQNRLKRQYRKAVKLANKLKDMYKKKYFIIMYEGRPQIFPKSELRELLKQGKFKKGVKMQDIENTALYVTA